MQNQTCPNCHVSLPGSFKVCGKCGARLGAADDSVVSQVNDDPSGAIKSLIGPGFSLAQPMTQDSRPTPSAVRPVRKVKRAPSASAGARAKAQFKVVGEKSGAKARVRRPGPAEGGNQADGRNLPSLPDLPGPTTNSRQPSQNGTACTICLTKMSSADKFCGKCGSPLAKSAPAQPTLPALPARCNSCGTEAQPGQKFCGKCGGRV